MDQETQNRDCQTGIPTCTGHIYSSDVRHGNIVSEVGRTHGRDCKSVVACSLVQFYKLFPRRLLPPAGERIVWVLRKIGKILPHYTVLSPSLRYSSVSQSIIVVYTHN